ncbi:MAG: hypothetical protein NVS2B12_26510 [Ktedonobacteraceae bacterium]
MAIGVLYESDTITQGQYEKIIELFQGRSANGRVFHVAGPRENGGWRVVDVFESPAEFEAFGQMFGPILQEAGIQPPQITVWPLHTMLKGPGHQA